MGAHCLFCGGVLDATARCEVCRVQRIAEDEKRIGAPCPRCESARLGPFQLGPVVVQGCVRCRGMFVATTEWDALLDFTRDRPLPTEIILGKVGAMAYAERASGNPYRETARDEDVDEPANPGAPNLGPPVLCPVCSRKMERIEFAGMSRIDVDVCAPHGIWLDAGELVDVVAQARGSLAIAKTEAAAFDEAKKESRPFVAELVQGLLELLQSLSLRRR